MADEMVTTMIIKVDGCKMFSDNTESNAAMIQDNETKMSSSIEPARVHDLAHIAETTTRIRELTQEKKLEETVAEDSDCVVCGSQAAYVCSECGKPVCEDCVTHTLDGRALCPSCYEKDDGVTI
jgi:hypothetical protein